MKLNAIFIIIIGVLLSSCDAQQLRNRSIYLEKGTDKLNKLCSALESDLEIPGLMLVEVNDTLLYGQFWPDEKFDVYRKDGQYFIPVGIWTGNDTCDVLEKYISDTKYWMFSNTRHRYIVPLSDLEMIDTLDCIRSNGISIVTYAAKATGLHGTLAEDSVENTLHLHMGTDYLINGGGTITVDAKVDSQQNSVVISPGVNRPKGIRPSAFLFAGGGTSFTPPSDNFLLIFCGDTYHVIIQPDSIYICPDKICDNILGPPAAKRRR